MTQETVTTWDEKRPPPSHWVMASYRAFEPLRLTRTCRHGCCVNQGFGNMLLPMYWRDATEEEIKAGSWVETE